MTHHRIGSKFGETLLSSGARNTVISIDPELLRDISNDQELLREVTNDPAVLRDVANLQNLWANNRDSTTKSLDDLIAGIDLDEDIIEVPIESDNSGDEQDRVSANVSDGGGTTTKEGGGRGNSIMSPQHRLSRESVGEKSVRRSGVASPDGPPPAKRNGWAVVRDKVGPTAPVPSEEQKNEEKMKWLRDLINEEKERQGSSRKWWTKIMFQPDSRFIRYWTLLVVVVLLWDAFWVFYRCSIGYDNGRVRGWYALDVFTNIIYILDVMINFRTGVQVAEDLVTDPKHIAKLYLKGYFVLDFIAAVPLDIIQLGIGYTPYLRINRLVRFVRIVALFSEWEGYIHNPTHSNVLKLTKLLFYLMVIFHWFGCGWWMIGRYEGFPVSTSVCVGSGNTVDYQSTTWAPSYQLSLQGDGLQLLQAWYWAFTAMTGLGAKVNPVTALETGYTLLVMLTGVCVYAYIIGSFGSLIGSLDATQAAFRQKLNHLNMYLVYRDIPKELRDRVVNFHMLDWAYHNGFDDNAILKELPQSLRTEIALAMNGEILSKVPLFMGAEQGMLSSLALMLTNEICPPNEYVFRQGEIGTKVYFIRRGKVAVLSKEGAIAATLSEGSFFGELSLLFADKRSATIRALTYCDLFALAKEQFDTVMIHFPRFHRHMMSVASKRQERARLRNKLSGDGDGEELGHHAPLESRNSTMEERKRSVSHVLRRLSDMMSSQDVTRPKDKEELELEERVKETDQEHAVPVSLKRKMDAQASSRISMIIDEQQNCLDIESSDVDELLQEGFALPGMTSEQVHDVLRKASTNGPRKAS